jgi:ADP-ribose pyrophosphatase YjhB (NUDIX family)
MNDDRKLKIPDHWLSIAKRINAISQTGLSFTSDEHDRERYTELLDLSIQILGHITEIENEKLQFVFNREKGYQTPKIAVRAVIFNDDKILMVKEKTDNKWAIPGGYAENGLSPSEIIIKEVKEESGFDVKPLRILGLIDYNKHQKKPFPFDVYQLFMECEIIGGKPIAGNETSEVGFFSMEQLPELSARRVTREQMFKMDELRRNKNLIPIFD